MAALSPGGEQSDGEQRGARQAGTARGAQHQGDHLGRGKLQPFAHVVPLGCEGQSWVLPGKAGM